MKKSLSSTVKGLAAVFALAFALTLSGCGDTPEVAQEGLETDSAYLSVLAAQNANAVGYSKAILTATKNAQIEEFANAAIAARDDEASDISRIQKDDRPPVADLAAAAETLGLSLSQLAITASGQPLTSPATDAGYINAMSSNDDGAVRASNAAVEAGSPEVMSFARAVTSQREQELDTLKTLR